MDISTPITEDIASALQVGDMVYISGNIYCGRDAVLPKIVKMFKEGSLSELDADMRGAVVFHTAVSPAGVGPTSSNKLEIENSIAPLSRAGKLRAEATGRRICTASRISPKAQNTMPQ